jgi:urease accessory protein
MDGPKLQPRSAPLAPANARGGYGRLQLTRFNDRTRVTRSLARQPLKLFAPTPTSHAALVYTTALGGGLLAGDHVHLDLHAQPDTTTFLTTQSATKIYRSADGSVATQTLHTSLCDDALLVAWPDPLICFADARYEQRQVFRLDPTASLALIDCQTAGRLARDERWSFSRYLSQNQIHVAGRLILNDILLFDPEDALLVHPFRTGRFNAMATVLLVGPRLERLAETLSTSANTGSSSFLSSVTRHNGVLIFRFLDQSPEHLTSTLRRLLSPLAGLLGHDPWSRKW